VEQHPAFDQFYAEHKDRIYRLCAIMVHDKAQVDDLFQEVLVKIWKGLPGFRNDASLDTWVYRIVNNSSINFNLQLQRNKARVDSSESVPEPDQPDRTAQDLLLETINRLTSADRMLIGLYLEGYAYKEIAEILGMTTSHVGVRINRIKTELKSWVTQHQTSWT